MAKKKSTKTTAKAKKSKTTKATKPVTKKAGPKAQQKPEPAGGKMSGLEAAAKVLGDAGEALNCKTIVERALAKGYWKTNGKTPAGTIYAAILRETQKKGKQARFRKAERGKFTLNK